MINPSYISKHSESKVGSMLLQGAFIVCLTLSSSLHRATGQSATNFDTQAVIPDKPVTQADKEDQPDSIQATASPVVTTSSRHIGTVELGSYLQTVSSTFSIGKRQTDVFGQPQDPNAKPIIKTPSPGSIKRAPSSATPLSEIVRLIPLNTVMPKEKKFLLGQRSVRQGDQLPLSYRGKNHRVQVTDITARQISFKNLDSGETAVRKLDMLPPGMTMTAGVRGITPSGMTKDRANAPIILEMPEPATN